MDLCVIGLDWAIDSATLCVPGLGNDVIIRLLPLLPEHRGRARQKPSVQTGKKQGTVHNLFVFDKRFFI